jgi:protein SCO1/2
MQRNSRIVQIAAWSILIGVIAVTTFLFFSEQARRSSLPVLGTVQPFTLTNQLGQITTLDDLKGKVWVSDIIFTRCPGPCPKMTQKMAELQKLFAGAPNFRSVTLTTDPDHDSPAILKKFSERFDADPSRWFFLTGTKNEIRAVAQGSLKLGAEEKSAADQESANDLFIHNTVFILVDKHGRLRGQAYESLEPDFHKIDADIRALLRES